MMYFLAFLAVPFTIFIRDFKVHYLVYLPLYGVQQLSIIVIGTTACFIYELPPASAMIVSCEMARISMKLHAYFREKMVNAVVKDKSLTEFIPEWGHKLGITVEELDLPVITLECMQTELARFGYFFLAPTLVYRDTYARSKKFRLKVFL